MLKSKLPILLALLVALILANVFSPFRVRQVAIHLAPEPVADLGGFAITNTLLASWLGMVALIGLALAGRRHLVGAPATRSLQNILETVFEALHNLMQSMVGTRARAFFPVVATFFLFILASNWLGLMPGFGSLGIWETTATTGERVFVPLLRGTTSDLNTTLALALCAVLSLQIYGVHFLGLRSYGARFFAVGKFATFVRALVKGQKPSVGLLVGGVLDIFIGLLEIFEDLTKVVSFSFRLFGNIFGGEALVIVVAFLAPYAIVIPFYALELFGGFIQAFIFAALTTAFLGRATHARAAAAAPHPPRRSA